MKNHPNFTVRVRAHSGLLSNHRIKTKDIAKIYEVTRQTVSNWIEYWEEFGIVGLYDHPRSGRPPKLNFFEKETVKALIEKTPHSPKMLLSKLFETMGKSISRSTLRRIAKNLDSLGKEFESLCDLNEMKRNFNKLKKKLKKKKENWD